MTATVGRSGPISIMILMFLFGNHLIAQQKGFVYSPTTRGEFINDQRIGVWEFRDTPTTVGLKIDYTLGELTYIKPDTSDFYVADGNRWKPTKLKIPCRPHGSMADLQAYYQEAFARYLLSEVKGKKNMEATIIRAHLVFEVDESGLANNPKVYGNYPDSFYSKIMDTFMTAPQFWIVGIDQNNNTVKTRLSVTFSYCLDECLPEIPDSRPESKTVLTIAIKRTKDPAAQYKTPRIFNTQVPFASANLAQAFSPDDEHILLEQMETENKITDRVGVIYNLSKGTHQKIPFMGVTGSHWVDPQRVLFKYNFANQSKYDGIYDVTKAEVTHYSDSVTYFTVCSPGTQHVAFSLIKADHLEIWRGSLYSLKKDLILKSENNLVTPLVWSPDGKYLLLHEQKHKLLKLSVWDQDKSIRTTVPLFGAAVSGWSADSDSIYLYRNRLGAFDIIGEIFRYSVRKDEIKAIFPKTNGLFDAVYSSTTGKFALIIREDLYIWDPTKLDKPQMIRKKAAPRLTWSNNGKLIAFYGVKDQELYVLDLETGKEKKITQFNNK
jgi:hypothetical protein